MCIYLRWQIFCYVFKNKHKITIGVDRGSAPSDTATPIFCGLCGRGAVLAAGTVLFAGMPVPHKNQLTKGEKTQNTQSLTNDICSVLEATVQSSFLFLLLHEADMCCEIITHTC